MAKEFSDSRYTMLKPVAGLHHYLLGWYDRAKRAMPWRETRDPYAIWLSETMLQQTQVETVKPYYHRFLQAFPTVADLARAELQQVLSLWAGLGYYRRARHLHVAAQRMVEEHGGKVPGEFAALLSLPGVGRYTAGAVGSIAFGLGVPVVDGNVMRVVSRLTGFDGDIAEGKHAAFFWRVAGEILGGAGGSGAGLGAGGQGGLATQDAPGTPASSGWGVDPPRKGRKIPRSAGRYGDINQAMMELGATVCTPAPGGPACGVCPVRGFCRAYAEGRQGELPVKRKRGAVAVVRGVALVITRHSNDDIRVTKRGKGTEARRHKGTEGGEAGMEVLVMQRPRGVVWEEMWEFPVVEGGGEGNAKCETRNAKGGEGAAARSVRRRDIYRRELHLDMSIKNGHGGVRGVGRVGGVRGVRGGGGVGAASGVGGVGAASGVGGVEDIARVGDVVGRLQGVGGVGVSGVGGGEGGVGEVGLSGGSGAGGGEGALVAWVEGVLGVRVREMVECGEVRHGLTHRAMEFRVVRGEAVGEGTEALRHKGTEGKTQNAKRTTQNVDGAALGGEGMVLPVGVGMGGKRYVGWRWVRWPLEERGEVPMGRVVGKVAEVAGG